MRAFMTSKVMKEYATHSNWDWLDTLRIDGASAELILDSREEQLRMRQCAYTAAARRRLKIRTISESPQEWESDLEEFPEYEGKWPLLVHRIK